MASYPVLITWGFDTKGKPELDCFLDMNQEDSANIVQHIYTRAEFTKTYVSMFHLPEDFHREDLAEFIDQTPREEVIKKLNESKVKMNDIVRKKHDGGNTLDFIMKGK
jgi:hypothetical protein